jgi:putative transposase
MLRVFRYRLYPTRAQTGALRWTLDQLRELYNSALAQRIEAYQSEGKSHSCYDQQAQLRAVRERCPELKEIHSHLLQDALTRLDRAYRAFFRRVKSGDKKPGFPRFKGLGRYSTFTFKDARNRNGVRLCADGKRLDVTGIGRIRIKLHRRFEGQLKQVSITLAGDGHWYALFCCDNVERKLLPATSESIGIDVGIKTFATLSNGDTIENPRFFESAQKELRRSQRRVCRRSKGSVRRRKAVLLLRAKHDQIRRKRLQFHHDVARELVKRYDTITIEDLNIRGLARGYLAKQILDAAWGGFVNILAGKAECAGRELIRVNPRGTSQECSGCGTDVPKGLGVRVHSCPQCGLVIDRDFNAAINIKNRPGHGRRGAVGSGLREEPRSPLLAVCGS